MVFTGLNELGVPQRFGIMSLNTFFFIAFIAYLMMGSYQDAVRVAGRANGGPPSNESTVESVEHREEQSNEHAGVEESNTLLEEKPSATANISVDSTE